MMLRRQSIRVVDTSNLMKRYSRRQSELTQRQRKYRKNLDSPHCFDRNEILVMESYKDTVGKLRSEKDALKAKLWTATGSSHTSKNSQALNSIKCLLDCYTALCDDVQHLKACLTNLNHALSVLDKEVYSLKINERKMNKHNYEKAFKRLQNLEDHYEDLVKIECKLSIKSEKLRSFICELLHERKLYSSLYTKYIQKLNEGKKYFTDLLHYSLNQIEITINIYEKMEHSNKRHAIELDRRKLEMKEIRRQHFSYETSTHFQMKTSAPRKLAPIPQKQIRRIEQTRNKYLKKINLYNDILTKIREYTHTGNVRNVILNFQEQESLYYSYFNYSNEISYRITLLNNSVGRLFKEVHLLKINNRDKQKMQVEFLENLNVIFHEKQKNNERLRKMSKSQDERIEQLFKALTLIRDQTRIDARMLGAQFLDRHEIDLVNLRQQMKLIEHRMYTILAATYWLERRNTYQDASTYLVKGLDKIIDYTTDINSIVPTTQCSECTEVDVKNLDDADEQNVSITPLKIMKNYVAEKVVQPDMQYRLHDIKECRLPRSRYLAQRQSLE